MAPFSQLYNLSWKTTFSVHRGSSSGNQPYLTTSGWGLMSIRDKGLRIEHQGLRLWDWESAIKDCGLRIKNDLGTGLLACSWFWYKGLDTRADTMFEFKSGTLVLYCSCTPVLYCSSSGTLVLYCRGNPTSLIFDEPELTLKKKHISKHAFLNFFFYDLCKINTSDFSFNFFSFFGRHFLLKYTFSMFFHISYFRLKGLKDCTLFLKR